MKAKETYMNPSTPPAAFLMEGSGAKIKALGVGVSL
jgi:hypothetical protein